MYATAGDFDSVPQSSSMKTTSVSHAAFQMGLPQSLLLADHIAGHESCQNIQELATLLQQVGSVVSGLSLILESV